MCRVFTDSRLAIRGCFDYKLKGVAKALHAAGKLERTCAESDVMNGIDGPHAIRTRQKGGARGPTAKQAWVRILGHATRVYNAQYCRTTGFTPAEANELRTYGEGKLLRRAVLGRRHIFKRREIMKPLPSSKTFASSSSSLSHSRTHPPTPNQPPPNYS